MEAVKDLITQAEFARRAGVATSSVSEAMKKKLKHASIGKFVDVNHPDAVAYLAKKRGKKSAEARPLVRDISLTPLSGDDSQDLDIIENMPSFINLKADTINNLLSMTLKEIIEQFGNEIRFKNWLDAARKLIDMRLKLIELDNKQSTLISRDVIEKHIFGYWDGLQGRLLSDAPRSITTRITGMVKAGSSQEEAEKVVRDLISSQIKSAKDKAIKVLKNA